MATTTPAQRQLASALTKLKELQDAGKTAIESRELTREQRTALERAGFLRRVVKGWYLPARPGVSGDSTAWFAGMLDFIGGYCESRYGEQWHLSPVHSLLAQTGLTALPKQMIIHAPRASNKVLDLPEDCSLVMYGGRAWPPSSVLARVGPLRVLTIPYALTAVTDTFFSAYPIEALVALTQIRDASVLNRILLEGHPVVAGRLAGALRAAGAPTLADDIIDTMRSAGFKLSETNPFDAPLPALGRVPESPYVGRMRALWPRMRDAVLEVFPDEPGLPPNADAREAYLADVQATYVLDAYHSLSIEGYRVTEELIRRVATGDWRPDAEDADAKQRDAMAAKGYFDAFNVVKESIAKILAGAEAGAIVSREHARWYRSLFAPSVQSGLLTAGDLAGYRNRPVFIKNARHVPPPHDAVRDMMPALFELLTAEPSAAVRAVLGHFFFVFIHPYMDGNGRMGRFMMNTMLASGGYPWAIIQVGARAKYFAALEAASTRSDIRPFAGFVARSMETTPDATSLASD